MLETGTKAPDFELPDQNGNMHKSVSYTHLDVYKRQCQKKKVDTRQQVYTVEQAAHLLYLCKQLSLIHI